MLGIAKIDGIFANYIWSFFWFALRFIYYFGELLHPFGIFGLLMRSCDLYINLLTWSLEGQSETISLVSQSGLNNIEINESKDAILRLDNQFWVFIYDLQAPSLNHK